MKNYLIFMTLIFLAMQLVRPEKINPPVDKSLELKAPQKVLNILHKSCYDCHSNETKWNIFADIAPFMWTIRQHVKEGRLALNFSTWKKLEKDKTKRDKKLDRIIQTIQSNIMPLPTYTNFHKDARLTKEQKEIIINWVNSIK